MFLSVSETARGRLVQAIIRPTQCMVLMNNEKTSLIDFAGAWGMDDKDYEDIKKRMTEHRRSFNESFENRLRNLKKKYS
mgnify:CR=1 FL=1